MGGDLPKVLYEVAGRPMVHWVVDACRQAGASPIILVVGHRSDLVREAFSEDSDVHFVEQPEQLGTGHAVNVCREELSPLGGDTFVLAGDGPLIRTQTLRSLLAKHTQSGAAATLATAVIDDPTGYGRIVRDNHGAFQEIVEEKNASADQKKIAEVYPSYACFDVDAMLSCLIELPRDDISGEYYLTDVPAMLKLEGKTVDLLPEVPPEDILSINTPAHLAEVDTLLTRRLRAEATA